MNENASQLQIEINDSLEDIFGKRSKRLKKEEAY